MSKYSKKEFEGFTHRFIVKMKVDDDWRNDVSITLYSDSCSYISLARLIEDKKSKKVTGFDIIHRATKEQDERASEFIDEVLANL